LAEDLRRFLADRPVRARRSRLPEHLWRWCRRNPVVAGLSGVIALLLMLMAFGWMYRGPQPSPTVDAFQAHSRWSGQAHWLPNLDDGPQITITVHERNGDAFTGSYTAVEDTGRYEWRIEGTVHQGQIQWHFTEVVHEAKPTHVVEHGRVEGKQDGETLDLLYRDDDSAARLQLRLQK
jgi:hypothetical protein